MKINLERVVKFKNKKKLAYKNQNLLTKKLPFIKYKFYYLKLIKFYN
jgi:hypothetical protein